MEIAMQWRRDLTASSLPCVATRECYPWTRKHVESGDPQKLNSIELEPFLRQLDPNSIFPDLAKAVRSATITVEFKWWAELDSNDEFKLETVSGRRGQYRFAGCDNGKVGPAKLRCNS